MSEDRRDLRDLFRRDIDRIELPPASVWLPGAKRLSGPRWRAVLAVPAAAAVVVGALLIAFLINLARTPQVSTPPSAPPAASATGTSAPSTTIAPSATATASASPSLSATLLPASTAVHVNGRLPASGQWALILRRTPDTSPTDPQQVQGAPRPPVTDSIMATPLSARATTPRDTIGLLSYTSQVSASGPQSDNLMREQFSPDGHRLVLSVFVGSGAGARLGLVVVDLVAGSVGQLTADAAYHDTQPSWSPKGDEIAFVRRPTQPSVEGGTLWIIRADGTGLRRVLGPSPNPPESTGLFSWNGDGTALGFWRGFEGSRYYVLELASGRTTEVGTHAIAARGLGDWRADRPAFAGTFMEGNYGGRQYVVIADDQLGGGSRDVVTGAASDASPYFFQARWRPGSNDLLYIESSTRQNPPIGGTPAAPTVTRTIKVTDASGRRPTTVKSAQFVSLTAAWSPDGRDVVVMFGDGNAGALLLIAPDGTNERPVQSWGGIPESSTEWIDLAVLGL